MSCQNAELSWLSDDELLISFDEMQATAVACSSRSRLRALLRSQCHLGIESGAGPRLRCKPALSWSPLCFKIGPAANDPLRTSRICEFLTPHC